MRIGIVGAGMAGLACAEGLAGQGHDVVLFDKGRGPGGRMSTRRMPTSAGEAYFDHGAQYFTVRDESFRRRVDAWIVDGVAAAWPSAGSEAYVGVPAMNAPVRQMANGQTVHWTTLVTRIERVDLGWRLFDERGEAVDVDIAIVAVPAEQASALLASIAPDLAARAMASASEPCWTLMLAFSETVAVARNCWRGDHVIGWAARNNSKPRRIGPESWVVQAVLCAIFRQARTGSPPPSNKRYPICWVPNCRPVLVRRAIGGASRGPARRARVRYWIAIAASESAAIG